MKSTLKFGLITGAMSIIVLFSSFSLFTRLNDQYHWNFHASTIRGIGGLLSIPIQAIGIYLAMQNASRLNGTLTYAQAVKTGLIVAVTVAIIVAVFSFIYIKFLNPGYRDFMVRDAQKVMIAKGESQEQITRESASVSKQFTPAAGVLTALIGQFGTGAILSLIIGSFIKTKKQTH